MPIDMRLLMIAGLYILKFFFGFWLYRTGKPYNTFILTVHKLVSLATLVYIIIIANHIRLDVGLSAHESIFVVITILLFFMSIGTGGVLSMDKPTHMFTSVTHKVAPFLSILSTAVSLYYLL